MKKYFLPCLLFICTKVLAQPCSTPFAKFGIAPGSGHCRLSTISFIDSSAITGDVITGYTWYFGDGGNSTLQNPQHQYIMAGTYTISQFVYTQGGCVDTFYSSYTIYPNPVPVFYLAADSVGSKKIQFFNLSDTNAGIPYSYQWDFGDGLTASLENPSHVYNAYGPYLVALTATSARGCSYITTRTLSVDTINVPVTCAVPFSANSNNGCFGAPSSFNIAAPTTAIRSIWDFGDGEADTLFNNLGAVVWHNYADTGTYSVTLTQLSPNGCTYIQTKPNTVRPRPHADFIFTPTPTCTPPYDVQFTSTATIASGAVNAASTSWNFGTGQGSGSGPNPTNSYLSPGTYNVRMIARSQTYNCRDTAYKTFITFGKPVVNLTYTPANDDPKTIRFTDFSYSATSPITQWFWDFGDGHISTEENPSHTYSTYGRYTIRHCSFTNIGCSSDTMLQYVYTDSLVTAPGIAYEASMGKEFWAGFGYQEKMRLHSSSVEAAKFSLYIAAGKQPATVTISVPGIPGITGFPKTVHVMADSILEITGFPDGDPSDEMNENGLPDTRLYFTGITKRGIHISSNQAIGAWENIWATGNSAGGSLLLPENVWGNDYTVQAMGGVSNLENPNSFFFVIARQDSTVIRFTPTADIIDSSTATIFTDNHIDANIRYHAGSTYSVTLHRGEVFNAMGMVTGAGTNNALGADLSGTRVQSTDPLKKIAVFGGNGRVLIKTSICNPRFGSDNLVQQMFPKTVWGTRYLTVPTKTMEYNLFRITVADPATVVKVNGTILPPSGLIQNSYYEFGNITPNLIESNKRVMVTQYIISGDCDSYLTGFGAGDPEMINLSPVKYAVNNVSVYSTLHKNTARADAFANFINVTLPTAAVASFRLDGLAVADTGRSSFLAYPIPYAASFNAPIAGLFRPFPADTNYSFARFRVAGNAVHTLHADSSFTAIAYAVTDGESNGYNAGFVTNFVHKQYIFTGTGNWNDPSNWQEEEVPPSILGMGSEIIVQGNAILNVPQTIEDGGMLTVMDGWNLTVLGNLLIWQ